MVYSLLEKFASYLVSHRGLSLLSVEAYQTDVKLFIRFLYNKKDEDVADFDINLDQIVALSVDDFRAWLAFRYDKKYTATSTERAIIALRSFFQFLESKYKVSNAAIKKITLPKKPKRLPKAIEEKEVFEIIDSIYHKQDWQTKRNKALAYLLYSTGLRISEALNIKRQDFEPNGDFIKVIGKGNKERLVPILKKVSKVIVDYIKSYPKPILPISFLFLGAKGGRYSPRMFQAEIKLIRERLDLANWVTPHSFRHSFATHIIENEGDIRVLKEILGHSSLTTTQNYIKVSRKAMIEAYNKYHPKKI